MWLPSTIGGGYFIGCTVRDTQNMYCYVWYNKVEKKRVTPKHMDVFHISVSLLQSPHSHFVAQRQSLNSKVLTSSYPLHGKTMETTSASKCLSITISHNLSWTTHVEDAAARGNRTVGCLRRNFRVCTPKVKSATYTTMVRPTLEYAWAAWCPSKHKVIHLLEKVQWQAAR